MNFHVHIVIVSSRSNSSSVQDVPLNQEGIYLLSSSGEKADNRW